MSWLLKKHPKMRKDAKKHEKIAKKPQKDEESGRFWLSFGQNKPNLAKEKVKR